MLSPASRVFGFQLSSNSEEYFVDRLSMSNVATMMNPPSGKTPMVTGTLKYFIVRETIPEPPITSV